MKLKTKIVVCFIAIISLVFPALVLAQSNVPSDRPSENNNTGGQACEPPDEFCPAKINNTEYCRINGLCVPKAKGEGLIGSSSVFEVIAIVLKWLLTLAGVVATVFLIIGGYQYITAAGNEELAEKGRKTLINAVIGIVVVVLSMAIVTIITNTLGSTEPLGSKNYIEKIV